MKNESDSKPGNIIVAGLINLETSVQIEGFPLEYQKGRWAMHGIHDTLGSVGFNVSAAATSCGAKVSLLSLIAEDDAGTAIRSALREIVGLDTSGIISGLPSTPRSVILVDASGDGAMLTDLKDAPGCEYPIEQAEGSFLSSKYFHACNIAWAYSLGVEAKNAGLAVSTDIQAITDLRLDEYNQRFAKLADLVFFSGEQLSQPVEEVIEILWNEYDVEIGVCGLGSKGAALGIRSEGTVEFYGAAVDNKVVNTTGGGDALVGGYLAGLGLNKPPKDCLALGQAAAALTISREGKRWLRFTSEEAHHLAKINSESK